jgi:hypothetical protein
MPSLDAGHANAILNASVGLVTLPPTVPPVVARLMIANGSATAYGTELASGGGYVSGTGAPVVTFALSTVQVLVSASAVTVTNMPAAVITGIELWDSAGTPSRKWQAPLSSAKTTNAGDTFSILAGSLTIAMG